MKTIKTIKTIGLVASLAVSSAFSMEEAFEAEKNFEAFQKAMGAEAQAPRIEEVKNQKNIASARRLCKDKKEIAKMMEEKNPYQYYPPEGSRLYWPNEHKLKAVDQRSLKNLEPIGFPEPAYEFLMQKNINAICKIKTLYSKYDRDGFQEFFECRPYDNIKNQWLKNIETKEAGHISPTLYNIKYQEKKMRIAAKQKNDN